MKIQPRDVIALISLMACFILIYKGINGIVSAVTVAIIGYYFSKRVYEEKNLKGGKANG